MTAEAKAQRRIVGVEREIVTNVTSTDFPGHYAGENHSWDLEQFRNSFNVRFHKNEPVDASFSLIGIDASVANAFRRILLAEIPTLAIEYVYMHNNTSVIQDEVLAHRLGLIPLQGGREGLSNFMEWYQKPTDEQPDVPGPLDNNTIVMQLQVECTRKEGAASGETDPHKAYNDAHVYAHQLKYLPSGRQIEHFSGDNAIRAVNPDILIAKLRPGQVIDCDLHAILGIGADHAKFSPVATASYRLLPVIDITKPILGKDALKFARCFPRGVVAIEKVTKQEASTKGSGFEGHEGEDKAVIVNAMKDTVSRECLRHEEFEGKVKLGRVRDHFIFSIESTGQWLSDDLFVESVRTLRKKCLKMKRHLASLSH